MKIKTAIENYLNIFASNGERLDKIFQLISSLDELALLANKVDYITDDTDYPDPPEYSYIDIRKKVTKVFPSLCYYKRSIRYLR